MYCCDGQRIHRSNLNTDPFAQGESLSLKGELEGITCGYRFSIAIVRDKPDSVSLLLLD